MPRPHARYYHHKLHAAEKEQRTIQASAQVGYLATTYWSVDSDPLPSPASSGTQVSQEEGSRGYEGSGCHSNRAESPEDVLVSESCGVEVGTHVASRGSAADAGPATQV